MCGGRGCTWSPAEGGHGSEAASPSTNVSPTRPARHQPRVLEPGHLGCDGGSSSSGPRLSLGQVSYFCSVQAGLQDHHWHHTASRIACIIDIRASGSHVKVWDVLAGERCHARPCALTHSSAAGRWLAAR